MTSKIYTPILVVALALNSGIAAAANHQMGHNMSGMTMELGVSDENLDLRFIDAMILHHQGAVSMAKEAIQKSQRPEIKKLALEIIKAQEKEITQLQTWRRTWYPRIGSTPMAWNSQMGHMMPMSETQREAMMMTMSLGNADENFDLRFINAMILHHNKQRLSDKKSKGLRKTSY
ncbi:DUF305 domain-containing protein [Thermosynechococcus sp. HN-54]|uniref:DUF305 domain-containing protein n=1 Tax=Thermosynechococcus sp. HN-54 TaxID=2933959 RepID=UPI00202CAC6A|nr:DUF305 domain-containing protein [Thermosynechococcus sp. HN-54]URR34779.1 DUF305 domain-containing protein [Thermosynechococcus sp. HN-54]